MYKVMSEVNQKICALTHFKAVAHSISHTQAGIRIILDDNKVGRSFQLIINETYLITHIKKNIMIRNKIETGHKIPTTLHVRPEKPAHQHSLIRVFVVHWDPRLLHAESED